jgi:hypothetical protein
MFCIGACLYIAARKYTQKLKNRTGQILSGKLSGGVFYVTFSAN